MPLKSDIFDEATINRQDINDGSRNTHVTPGEVTTLQHEARDDTVESRALVA